MPALMIVFSLVALLFIGLALPLMLRRVKPNYLYGLRVPATLSDEVVWYEANARCGRDLFSLGLVELLFALLPTFDRTLSLEVYVLGNAFFLTVGTIGLAIIGWLRANRMLKQRRAGTL